MKIGSVDWNNRMYRLHRTPHGTGIAGRIQNARVNAVLKLASVQPDDRVLEIGCESGHLSVRIPSCKSRVGMDISTEALADARELAESLGEEIEFVQHDAHDAFDFSPGDLDVIISSEMLEHVNDPGKVIRNVHAICSPDTRVVFTVPIEKPKLVIKKVLETLRVFDLLFPGIEKGQSEWHLHQFSRKMILDLCKGMFTPVKIKNVWGSHWAILLKKNDDGAVDEPTS